jgi:hypothetical protein
MANNVRYQVAQLLEEEVKVRMEDEYVRLH